MFDPANENHPVARLRAALAAHGEHEWVQRLDDALGGSAVSGEILCQTALVLADLQRTGVHDPIAGLLRAAMADVQARQRGRRGVESRNRRPIGVLLGLLMAASLLPLAAVALLTIGEAIEEHRRDLRLMRVGERRDGIVVEAGRSTPEDAGAIDWSRVEVTLPSGFRRVFDVEEAHRPGARVPMLVLPSTAEGDGAEAVSRRLGQWPFSPWIVFGVGLILFEVFAVVWVCRLARQSARADPAAP